MNILLINHYAGSPEMGMEFRPYYFAREWVKMGHSVRIIGADFSHLRQRNPVISEDFQIERIDGIEYQWVHTRSYAGNGAQRALTMAQFVGKLWLHAREIAKECRPDVVIASSTYPLDTYAARRIARIAGAKLVHEVHDMWPLSPMVLGGMSKYHPFIVLMQMAENAFCRHSDAVVSLLPAAGDYFVRHGMKPENFYHVPNGIVLEEWEQTQPLPMFHQQVLDRLRDEGKFVICFFGSHLETYAIEDLIEAVRRANDPRLHLVFVGKGNDKEKFIAQAAEKIPQQATFLDPIPKAAVPALLTQIDALFIGLCPGPLQQYGICMNKLFDSMMSGKPILFEAAVPNDYIREYGCGVSVEPGDVDALVRAIETVGALSGQARNEMGARGRAAVLERFNYSVLPQQFIEILTEVTSRPSEKR